MLEFIVLGEVPGTGFIMTFSWIIALATIMGGSALLRRVRKQRIVSQQVLLEETTI